MWYLVLMLVLVNPKSGGSVDFTVYADEFTYKSTCEQAKVKFLLEHVEEENIEVKSVDCIRTEKM